MNAWIVKITREIPGMGGDPSGEEEVLLRDVVANRQPAEVLREDNQGGHQNRADTDFYIDLPEPNPFLLKLDDVLTWRRYDPVLKKPVGPEYEGAVIQAADVHDHTSSRLSHVRIQTRGGDGSGS